MPYNRDERQMKASSEHLNAILDEFFHGDRQLMALACGTTYVTLNNWLKAKNQIRCESAFHLNQAVPAVSEDYITGKSEDRGTRKITEYWETLPLQQQADIYRRDIVLMRLMIANRDAMWRHRQETSVSSDYEEGGQND